MRLKRWVRVKSRREPVSRVAARMLRSRIGALARLLPLAAQRAQENLEYVHQLRVWSRRADAAVDLCRDLLRKRDRRKLEKHLERIRDAAAAARDADVLLRKIGALKRGAGRELLMKQAVARRAAAQSPIVELNDRLQGGRRLLRRWKRLRRRLSKVRRNVFKQPFTGWAHKQFRPIAKKFIRRGQDDLSDLAALHRFRIAGKQLRYAMELVADAYGNSLRKKAYPELVALQSQLGAINDAANLVCDIERALSATTKRTLKTQLNRLLIGERKRLTATHQAFVQQWTAKRAKRLKRRLEGFV